MGTIFDRVQHELDRQHITKAELMQLLGMSEADYAGLAAGELTASTFGNLAAMLGCTCDYLCGRTETGYATKHDNEAIGFTCKGRMEHLVQQLDSSQQWEVFRMVADYCLAKGITYSRLDARKNRERVVAELICALSELRGESGCDG